MAKQFKDEEYAGHRLEFISNAPGYVTAYIYDRNGRLVGAVASTTKEDAFNGVKARLTNKEFKSKVMQRISAENAANMKAKAELYPGDAPYMMQKKYRKGDYWSEK